MPYAPADLGPRTRERALQEATAGRGHSIMHEAFEHMETRI